MDTPDEKNTHSFDSLDPLAEFVAATQKAVEKAASELDIKNLPQMEIPPSTDLGDFAYPCFAAASERKGPPQKVAEELAGKIGSLDRMEIIPVNGYLNFKIDLKTLISATLPLILRTCGDYGKFPDRNIKVILEHTSANPNGPFHVGRARNPIIGDTLARILRRAGYNVEVQYWVNDLGKQAAILGWGVQNFSESDLPAETSTKPDHVLVRYYQSAYKEMEADTDVDKAITELIRANERGVQEEIEKLRKPCEKVLSGMVESLERMNIHVDKFVWESESVLDGTVDEVIKKLKSSPLSHEDNGAYYLDLEEFDLGGKTSRFVYTRGDGTSLYTTRDLAYHSSKLKDCDIAVNILGEDHKLQARQLKIALEILGLKNMPEVVFYSFVSLEEGKMSTRRGTVVYLDDLMDEAVTRAVSEVKQRRSDLTDEDISEISEAVGLGAIRYNIIHVQPDKRITFRWKDALNFEGNSAPFVQYSHARACSILRKADVSLETKQGEAVLNCDPEMLTEHSEEELIRSLAKLPSLIIESADSRKPHPIANYGYRTASLFNQFYHDCPVLIAEPEEKRESRLALVQASRWCLANTLDLLGITAPMKM